MNKVVAQWRKLLTAEQDDNVGDSYDNHHDPLFADKDREGVDNLTSAEYVEVEKFKAPVLDALKAEHKIAGYFCATCVYYRHDESKKYEGYCEKLEAEDAAWGCCDRWELNKSGKIKEAE